MLQIVEYDTRRKRRGLKFRSIRNRHAASGGAPTLPGTPTIDLTAASDLGFSSTDNVTTDTTLDFDIGYSLGMILGDTLHLEQNGVEVASHTLDAGDIAGGDFNVSPGVLVDGVYSFRAKITRGALFTAWSAALVVKIDNTSRLSSMVHVRMPWRNVMPTPSSFTTGNDLAIGAKMVVL